MSCRIDEAISHSQVTADATTPQTLTPAAGARAVLLTATTQDAIVTFDGTTPATSNGIRVPKALLPVRLPIPKQGQAIKVLGAAASSVVDALWVR